MNEERTCVESVAPDQQDKRNPPKTTTISTIAVQSGKTRLVIALLQSGDWINLKILEVEPELTKLGPTLSEALELQKAHDEVLLQLQNKQSPVEELLRQADQLISTQRPRAEVYAAMAESLGRAWQDVNQLLELRKQILDLNVLFWERAELFRQRQRDLEQACKDSMVPVEIEAVKKFLTDIHDMRRSLLEALMGALKEGSNLLAKIKELGKEGTLDSRPERIRASVNRAIAQVEKWLDDLHMKRQYLEMSWQSRKTQLEQCLALAILARDLRELEETVTERRNMLTNTDHLGDSVASAELFLHEHQKLLPESRQLQERAIKITKATEQLVSSGCFAGEQATSQAYVVLSATSDYIADLETRNSLLVRAIEFFKNAHQALSKLDQLEVELTESNIPKASPKLSQLHAKCANEIEEITAPPIKEGYELLDEAGRGKKSTDGVKMMVEELENRKIFLDGLCTAHKEENLKISQAICAFLEKQNDLFSWLINVAEAFLKEHKNMGENLEEARYFVDLHSKLLNDLQTKGNEINSLLLTLPPILEFLDDSQRQDIDIKVEALHEHWLRLKNILEKRLELASLYCRFFNEANTVSKEMDNLEDTVKNAAPDVREDVMNTLEEKWSSLVPLYQQAKNTGLNFISLANDVSGVDPHLDVGQSRRCVERELERLASRQINVTNTWQTFTTERTEKRELLVLWEQNMAENTKTIDWASKLDAQLYPVITSISTSPRDIAYDLENKQKVVLTEIKKAQNEVDQRVKMTESLIQRSPSIDNAALNIKNKLNELSQKLVTIITDYQVLLEVLIGYFKNLIELERTIDNVNRQYEMAYFPRDLHDVENMIRDHAASKQAILEMFKFAKNECEQIIPRIQKQEPPRAADHDIDRLLYVLNANRDVWEAHWNKHNEDLEQHKQLCQFDFDLHQINESLDDLSHQLAGVKGQFGESSASAKSTSLAFTYFEKTIELLQQRIQVFVESGEKLLAERHGQSPHIERELNKLKQRWADFQQQVIDTRKLIDLSIVYFQLVEEADEWFREGSKLLVTIARKSTAVKTPNEATELLNEIAVFLRPGEERQNERIKKISEYAVQLFGISQPKEVTQVIIENKEMLDSFTQIQNELNTLTRNLKAAEEQRERMKREQEEAERRRAIEEEERKRRELEEAERRKREQEEADRRRLEEEARLKREKEEFERRRKEEEDRLRNEREAEEERRRREEERIRLELEELRKREEEARLRREREEEEQRQREAERLRQEQEEFERKKREDEERRKREQEELERKRLAEEEERKRRERELAEQQKREEEERQKIEAEKLRIKQEEAELQKKAQEEADRLAAEKARIDEEKEKLEAEKNKLLQEAISFKEHVEKIHTIHVEAVTLPEKSQVEITEIIESLPETKPPVFVEPLTDAVVQEGSKFTFKCQVDGFPAPVVTWHKDGMSIQNNPDYQTTYDQGVCTLSIEETFTEDSARYSCKAFNAAGTAETSAILSVTETEPEEQLMPPTFSKILEPGIAKEGGKFQFECKVEGNPLPTVQWFKNHENIDNSPDFSITYNNGEAVLKFQEVFLEDRAEYTCRATNELGMAQTTASLTVEPLEPTAAPEFIVPLSNIMARTGQKIKLECQFAGLPTPQLTWTHNGKPIKENRDLKLQCDENNKAILVISEAFPKDAGIYVVTAANIAGEATSACNVSVKGRLPTETSDSELASDMEPIKPTIQVALKDVSVFEGKKVRLDCVIVGQPEPEVIWYHDDRPVKESTDFQLLFQGDRCSLIIQEAYAEDAGDYKVVAINSAGEASSKCSLKVTPVSESEPVTRKVETPVYSGSPPKFTKLLSDVLVSEGERIILECAVSGEPVPEIHWFLNNQEIQANDHVQLTHAEDGIVKLEIDKVTPDDKGVYTVKASNYCGDAKCFAQLIVKSLRTTETSKIFDESKTAPSFKELFADRTCFENQTTKFECKVVGKPTPKIKWLFNGDPVSGKDFLVSTSGDRQVLAIPEVSLSNQGKITCVAENEVGKASCEAYLSVQPSTLVTLPEMELNLNHHVDQSYSVKREVFVSSSSSSSQFISSSTGGEPQTTIQSMSSQDHKSFKQINEQPPEIIESHKVESFQKINDQTPIITEKSITSVSSGKEVEPPKFIIQKSVRKSTPPRFVTPVVGKIVDQGVDVTLEGILDGHPTPEVTWSKNGTTLTPTESINISFELNHAKLVIKNVNVKDAGKYTCTAVNEAGSAVSTTDLVVKKTIFPPVFGRRLQAQVVKKGDRVIMEVEVTGTPEPTISWHKDGLPVESSLKTGYRTKTQGNCHTLIIDKALPEHTGKYMVRALNSGGEAQSIADVAIFEPTPDTMVEVVKTVVFEDVEKQEILSTPAEKQITTMPEYKPVTVDIPITLLPEIETTPLIITKEEKIPEQPIVTQSSHVVSSSEFSNITESRVLETKKFVLEHQTPYVPFPEKIDTKPIAPIKHEPIVHQVPVSIEKDEVPKSFEETGIETSSISKQSSLGFFVSKMKESEEPPAPKVVEVQKISSDVFSKFETPVIEKMQPLEPFSPPTVHHFSPIPMEPLKPFSPQPVQQFSSISTSQSLFEEFNLVPEPPPEIGFIPKSDVHKKPEMPERIKKLEVTQKELSPVEVPTGAIKIFPTVQTRQEEITKESYVKKHEFVSEPSPILRPQADIPIRPSSPRPSAEALEMEKMWIPKPKTPEPVRPLSPLTPSRTATLEKKWTPHSTEFTEQISSSSYTSFEKVQQKSSGIVEPSLEGKTMEKMWAHKHADSHLQKVWPPPQTEEEKIKVIPMFVEKTPELPKVTPKVDKSFEQHFEQTSVTKEQRYTPEVREVSHVTHEEKKHWAPVHMKFESSKLEESSNDAIFVPGPIHYVSDTTVTHISNVLDTSYSSTKHTEITKTELRNENVIEESHKPSEIIKTWPPAPSIPEPELRAPQMVRETFPKIDSLPVRPVSVADITDEIYLEPGPPPEIGFAEPPRERRQSYVESIEQDLEKNLEKEPTRVLPGSVRTIPPPREKSLSRERTIIPPPIPPKKEQYQAPPLPIKPVKVETPKVEPPSKPFEKFPDLEPFPFKPDPSKPKGPRLPPPPTPSKFIKGKFTDSDYESDFEAVRIPPKWKPCQSDTEEFSYRKVKPPKLTPITRARSTEPEPIPPSKFDQPPIIHGPPRPNIDLEKTKQELKQDFAMSKQLTHLTNKKETKTIHHQQIRKPASPPKLKPGSPPEFIHTETPKHKPESPKVKHKVWQESGYMADTDEPLIQKSIRSEHHESLKTETKHYSYSSQESSQVKKHHSMFETHSSSSSSTLPHSIPSRSFHKHEQKKQVSSTALKKELVAPVVSITNQQKQVREEDYYKVETPKPKRGKLPPPPSPSKFVKGEFRESDYESDFEGRIPPVWNSSDATDGSLHYKPVRPVLTPSGRHSRGSTGARTPTPPTEFDNPPQIEYPPRPKFEPIEKPKQTIKLEEILKTAPKQQVVVKPKVVQAKPMMELVVATPARREEFVLKPGSPPEIAYAPGKAQYYHSVTTTPYANATQTETSNIMHFNESTEKSHRVVSLQQTTRVIKFGDQKKEQSHQQVLEPFPFKPEPERPKRISVPPPPKPKKFIPGEFRESDYESEVEGARIKPKWKPGYEQKDEPQYKRVCPPSPVPLRSASVPVPTRNVQTPMEFDTQPPKISSKKEVYESQGFQRTNAYKQYHEEQSQSQDLVPLKPGSPPQYAFSPVTKASELASRHMEDMTHTFKSTTQRFVNDIMGDVKKQQMQKQKSAEAEDPQAYREESRVAEYGTKHIDPDTGLIYFKYDFGYEFGVILPGEGGKQGGEVPRPSKTKIQPPKRAGDIEMPVYHESTNQKSTSKPQFRPKKVPQTKNAKWEPTSESEMSEIEGDFKKRQALLQPDYCSNRWDPASTSPLSISPVSPAFNNFLAGGSGKTQRKGNETPPSTPSTPGSLHAGTQHSNIPKRAPMFITPLRDIAVVSGQTARFECIVQSEPTPSILWSKNGRIIQNSPDYQIQFRNGVCRLSIPQAYPEDAGTYTCTATNQVGVVNTSATLQVPGERRSSYI